MKFLNGFIFFNGLVSGRRSCDISDLALPVNAEKWNCTGATGNKVQAGNKCTLQCGPGYNPAKCEFEGDSDVVDLKSMTIFGC